MAVPLLAVAIGMELVQGSQQKQAADYNAQIEDRNAQLAMQKADMDTESIRRQARFQEGAGRAAYAGSGVSVATGSPLDELAAQHIQNSFKERAAFFNDQLEADNDTAQANINRFLGQEYMTAAMAKGASTVASFYGSKYGGGGGGGGGVVGDGTDAPQASFEGELAQPVAPMNVGFTEQTLPLMSAPGP